jgi:hypothetical protein
MLAKAYLLQITPPKNPQRTLMFSLDSKNQIRTRRQTWSPYIARVRYVQKTWTGQSPITTAMSPANMINADGSPTIDPLTSPKMKSMKHKPRNTKNLHTCSMGPHPVFALIALRILPPLT